MKYRALVLALAIGLVPAAGVFAASPSTTPSAATEASPPQLWSAWGGTVEVRWNRDLAADVGMQISSARDALPGLSMRGRDRFDVRRSGSLAFHVDRGYFRGFDGGSLQASGGYTIGLHDGSSIDFSNFRLRANASDPLLLDFVGSDGQVWFYIDRLMYELMDNDKTLAVGAMDMRISPALAERIGHPEVAGWAIADLAMTTEVQTQGVGAMPLASSPRWPGTAAPNGGTYEADLFMQDFTMQYTRCQGCSGPSGTGKIVFTPSSTLKNNVNAGTFGVTIPGQGALGTSSAAWTAGIAWNQKFTGNLPPYGNDQHPYLIWNLYRTNADGSIEQIGRSGVKHAWLTTNGNCADSADHDSHILGRSCSDTYGTGNNDTSSDLGPRSEIVPATGIWGRCGSIYDRNCVGSLSAGGNGDYDQRLIVREQQVSATGNPGATYLFESWYIARDDHNPYNSMATKTGAPSWSGSSWAPGGGSGYKLGPAIDRWVDPANQGANARSSELATREGHGKLAVKAVDLGGGLWRYDYAVMNVDFARAITSGSAPNVRVTGNKGFNYFSVPLPAGANVSATRFSDGDVDASNDWTVSTSGGSITWNAPAAGNTLDWGTLFSFSLTVDKAPAAINGELGVAEAGSPSAHQLLTLAPAAADTPVPTANVTPASFTFNLLTGATTTDTLAVANTGASGSSLLYMIGAPTSACGNDTGIRWLSAASTSGSVASGGNTTIAVTADSTGLGAGTYTAKLCVGTGDPAHALIEVPVSLTVATTQTYTVGGTVSSLSGSGLVLKLNGAASLPVSANGAFTFPSGLATGTAYAVTVDTQPASPAQTCTVANGSGTIGSANVTNVAVTCTTAPTYTVGGTVGGLSGSGLVLKLNNSASLPVSGNGTFTFPGGLSSGTAYAVTVGTQPSGQVCSITNGSGTMGAANVSNVAVNCTVAVTYTIGGSVNGLSGSGLVLSLNGTTSLPVGANGAFTFPGGLVSGTAYAVTVATQPSGPAQTCTVANGSGAIGSADVSNVLVTCAGAPPPMYTVGGRVSGVAGSGLVLQINGSATLSMGANGLFVFTDGLPTGATYSVTVATQPSNPTQTCTVANGSGTIGSANVTNVAVTCATFYTIGGSVGGLVGSGLALKLNGGADLPVNANGTFTFPSGLAGGVAYAVTVGTQPSSPAQTCSVANGSGMIAAANITNIVVSCTIVVPDRIFVDGFETPPAL